MTVESASSKVVEPALECAQKLFSQGAIRGEIDAVQPDADPRPTAAARLVDCVCRCDGLGEEVIELGVLRVLVAAARSPVVALRGECLVNIVKSCYNVYLSSSSGASQLCAKAVLAQILLIVFARVEVDAMDVKVKSISIVDILDLSDKNLNDSNLVQFAQNFINEVMEGSDGDLPPELQPGKLEAQRTGGHTETGNGEADDASKAIQESTIREDGLFLFKNLCKLSMKFSTQDNPEDSLLLRGKVLALELLKIVMEHAGQIWRTDEKFLGAIKQYLCLSLLKNSALSVMSIFQLLCSIFMSLLSRFRSGLKSEIGIFFPMLILRVLENVSQPSFMQKMTVLNMLERISQDPQIIVDLFVNYDCDVDAPNIFERTVNGLLKTALGVPPGSATTLSPAQDSTFRLESVKCLVSIVKSMGTWLDQQLRIGDFSPKTPDFDLSSESQGSITLDDGAGMEYDLHGDVNSGLSDAATLEQRRAHKMEIQKGISLFNRKPSKGIEFLIRSKKIGGSPEEVASFLRNASGLNEMMIGDYLGERDEFPLKVMHAYVDSLNFEGMDFGEAIRFFLRGFRLPGEAQKIDRIMEKFAERYCKCNPSSFTSADTAYVLAYSVIMLNTDAHNNMVKDKMSKADFIRNNRGIDDGKDLPEVYLESLYDQIVKNEIKMKADYAVPQHKQTNSLNKLLGLDGILNLVMWKQPEEKPLGANDALIKHIQEQFKAKSSKSEPVFYTVTDTTILRFMIEACWAQMMAAFSMTLDQSDDKVATSQCLQGFKHAVHVTSVMCMQTQRDAFVTSVAKFTYLHNAADMKQKNVDAVKAIITIAIEDGNYLQEAWEHVLTCLSRFEHLQLLGDGAPTDASFFTVSVGETDEKPQKTTVQPLKKKSNALQNPAVAAAIRGGSYDSTTFRVNAPKLVTPEQINNFISNINLLDQIGNFELNHIFAHSQRLNSEAIVAFVKALCKVSMAELQSPTDPRVFSLTKIVEIAHYNMNRIRLVWSRIWNVLSDFFVTVGISENLSVAIFVMDSLRQLSMKFLEREELANYNFQNEFLRPFVIVMQKSNSAEIRELIVRCISQMVLSRVNHVKSGWKSVFLVFTTAADDDRKNIVQLAFETMEKIVRDYFSYITETETTIFTDCVKCLITFTGSKFSSDVSLNAIAFLRFCAVKLAEGGLICYDKNVELRSHDENASDGDAFTENDEHVYFWVPLLAGLSRLTSDPRSTIRKGALEVLFDILRDHGHLFSRSFWTSIFKSVIFPIFNDSRFINYAHASQSDDSSEHDEDIWSSDAQTVAAQCLVDLFVKFFDVVGLQLPNVASVLAGFITSPRHNSTRIGVNAILRLTGSLGSRFSEKEWSDTLLPLKERAASTIPEFVKIVKEMDKIDIPDLDQANSDAEICSEQEFTYNDFEETAMELASYAVVRMKGHIAVQLLLVETVVKLYEAHSRFLSAIHVKQLLDILSVITSHSTEVSSESVLQKKLRRACAHLEISDPPVVHFQDESHKNYLNLLQSILDEDPLISQEIGAEYQLMGVCERILQIYLHCAGQQPLHQVPSNGQTLLWILPLGSARKEELAARTSLLLLAMQVLKGLERDSFRRHISRFFPLLVNLIRCEHSSGEVQPVLSEIFTSSIGPILLSS